MTNTFEHSINLTPAELDAFLPDEYMLVDTRTQEEYEHGFIPGCVLFSPEQIRMYLEREEAALEIAEEESSLSLHEATKDHAAASAAAVPGEAPAAVPEVKVLTPFSHKKKVVLYCKNGTVTKDLADEMRMLGYEAYSLTGGYGSWALHAIQKEAQNDEVRERVERGLQKKFHADLLNPFARAILKYNMIENGDKIAVCISGGKDSMIMAKLFQEFQKHGQFQFELVFLCMDPGYNEANRHIIESNARMLGVPMEIFETNIFDSVYNIKTSPCYLCARMRRGYLYKEAKARGCNKIALGHHFDDAIETALMGMLNSGQFNAMMPKLRSTSYPGMELIRPLYFVREDDIKHWRDYNNLHFIQCACHFTDTCTTCAVNPDGTHTGSKRVLTKQLIASLKKDIPDVETNIFHATENVTMDQLLGWKEHGVKHSFLDEY